MLQPGALQDLNCRAWWFYVSWWQIITDAPLLVSATETRLRVEPIHTKGSLYTLHLDILSCVSRRLPACREIQCSCKLECSSSWRWVICFLRKTVNRLGYNKESPIVAGPKSLRAMNLLVGDSRILVRDERVIQNVFTTRIQDVIRNVKSWEWLLGALTRNWFWITARAELFY